MISVGIHHFVISVFVSDTLHRDLYYLRHEHHYTAVQRINSVLESHISMLDQVIYACLYIVPRACLYQTSGSSMVINVSSIVAYLI